MANNFSPFKGSYVLNQFPSNVMFGMNGFHVSASGAIQGHHVPLVYLCESVHLLSSLAQCEKFSPEADKPRRFWHLLSFKFVSSLNKEF